MEVFVARQPIFSACEEVYGYELLYRSSNGNFFPDIDGDRATAEVIINSFLNIGMDELAKGKPCFVNFTENLLKLKLPTYFKPGEIVVEILETVEPSLELLGIVRDLKEQGYTIALDDFSLNENNPYFYSLLQDVDIIKVDFRQTSLVERRKIEKLAREQGIFLLAEKIETRDEFKQASESGYHYFQGYFFAEPVIVTTKDVPAYFYSYYQILQDLSRPEPSVHKISELISQDLSLSYKLLKLINSAAYRPTKKIHSIRQAVVLLGFIEINKWISIMLVRDTFDKKNGPAHELVSLSLIRAKSCELLSQLIRKNGPSSAYFITGLYSLMDALLKMPIEKVLSGLPLDDAICDALKGVQNYLKDVLDLSIAIEKGEWQEFERICGNFGIKPSEVLAAYQVAIDWGRHVLHIETDAVDVGVVRH